MSRKLPILAILLILVFCLTCVMSCAKDGGDETDSPQTQPTTQGADEGKIILSDGAQSEFRIIRPADCDDYVKQLANSIREKIKNSTGVNIRVFTDATPRSDGIREILIGNTNRSESAEAYKGLKYNDWRICAEDKTVAIAAFNEETLEFAVKRFLGKTQTADKTMYYKEFTEEKLRVYDVAQLTVGGTDISEYTIVCESKDELAFAKSVRDLIAVHNGSYLDITDKAADADKPFYIGSAHYTGDQADKETKAYTFGAYGGGVSLWYSDAAACLTAFTHLENGLKGTGTKADIKDLLPGADIVNTEEYMNIKIMSFNVQNGWNSNNIGDRDDLAAGKILYYLPDVIGFQEFDPYYREAVQPLQELIASKYTEVNVTNGTTTTDKSWNPIFYNPERLTPKVFGSEVYRDGTFHQSYPHGGISMFRTISWVVFEDNDSKQSFLFVNTHYDMNNDAATMEANQRSEAAQLIELVNRLKQTYGLDTVFVVGDYNATANGVPSTIMKDQGFRDTWDIAVSKDDVTSCGTLGEEVGGKYSWAIDHVFYMASSVTVENYKTITDIRNASDHCPIFVNLTVKISK